MIQDPVVVSDLVQEFQGLLFYRKTGKRYFVRWANERPYAERHRVALHRAVWEAHNGPIPRGRKWHVHHLDGDRTNNAISNLELVTAKEHAAHHWDEARVKWARENIAKTAQPAAKVWHGSDEGRAWHRLHAAEVAAKTFAERTVELSCAVCGITFMAYASKAGPESCCSQNCRARRVRARRAQGIPVDPTRQTILRVAPKEKTCQDCGIVFLSKSGRVLRCPTCR